MHAAQDFLAAPIGHVAVAPAPPYTARAIKGTALLDEMRMLLRAWQPGEDAHSFRQRIRDEDLLGKATAARRDDLARRVFQPRFLAEGHEPASSLRRLLEVRGNGPWFAALCLLFAARADEVLRDTVSTFLPAMRARGVGAVTTPALIHFLEDQEEQGRMARPWSSSVRKSVAQHVLHQLTDLDVLGPPRRGIRTILPYAARSLPFAWLVCDLRRHEYSDAALVAHRDFRIWQMTEASVREALDRLSELGLWVYQGAGSVVRLAFPWSDWNDVLTVLGGPSVD